MREPVVAVAGSVHMDLIATADRLPRQGETLSGHAFSMLPGGKGGNQAIQVAMQGVHAIMIGHVGADLFGERLRSSLVAKGVDVDYLLSHPAAVTGASTVLVGEDGDYASIVVPTAGRELSARLLTEAARALESATVFLAQLEMPRDTVTALVELAEAKGNMVVVNAAPAPEDSDLFQQSFWNAIDILVVNQVEAETLAGLPCDSVDQAVTAARQLRQQWKIRTVIVTLGATGVVAVDSGGSLFQAGWPVTAVDTLGAGDAFVGTLAARLAAGESIAAILPFAAAAGALAVTCAGAYDALPSRDAVDRFLAEQGE